MFLLGTSWKMHKTRVEARAWIEGVRAGGLAGTSEASSTRARPALFVVPPFTAIEATLGAVRDAGLSIDVGAQSVHEAPHGAFTGEVSAPMLVELGCGFVELGHSERRRLCGETDARVAAKVRTALDHGLRPLVCVGDSHEERDAGADVDAVLRQASLALAGCTDDERARCRLAWEPVWAIGTGAKPASPADAERVHGALRERFPRTPLLYGGSVDADNAAALAHVHGVDGLFVGRAALDPAGFVAIARAVADAVRDAPPERSTRA